MPIGLSLIGMPDEDIKLLRIAEMVGSCFKLAAQAI